MTFLVQYIFGSLAYMFVRHVNVLEICRRVMLYVVMKNDQSF